MPADHYPPRSRVCHFGAVCVDVVVVVFSLLLFSVADHVVQASHQSDAYSGRFRDFVLFHARIFENPDLANFSI